MKLSTKIVSIMMAILIISNIAYAGISPNKCPGIESIKTIGFDAVQAATGGWTVIQRNNNFDTNVSWTFYVNVKADNENDAKIKAITELQSLYLFNGPSKNYDSWGCIYLNDAKNYAIAVTPPIEFKQLLI